MYTNCIILVMLYSTYMYIKNIYFKIVSTKQGGKRLKSCILGAFQPPEMLFGHSKGLRELRLRGKIEDAMATELPVLELESFFCEGSNIYKAGS